MSDPSVKVFELALGLTQPWFVQEVVFDPAGRRLDIHLDFEPGGHFRCPEAGCGRDDCPAHDTHDDTWRHLNFFQHECYLHARVPRVRCPEHGVRTVSVPWARDGSDFTLLFEALCMAMMREMPVLATARIVGVHDTRLWRLLHRHVEAARAREDFSQVAKVGVDETSSRRGHHYVTQFVDLERSKTLFVTSGRDHTTVERFREDLIQHGGQPKQIREFSLDMSEAFVLGITENFEDARLTFDKYHVVQLLNKAVDEVRRQEQKTTPALKRTRYLWLKNQSRLTDEQQKQLRGLRRRCRQTGRAYQLKLQFQEFWQQDPETAPEYLADWCLCVARTRLPALEPMRKLVATFLERWDGIVEWFHSRVNNGVLEAINGLVQAAKRRARGYRNERYFQAMIYMVAGKLTFPDIHSHLAGLPT